MPFRTKPRPRSWVFIAIAVLFLLPAIGVSIAAWVVPELNWRARVLAMQWRGEISDLSWSELLTMLRPGGKYYLKSIIATKNPYSVITNPFTAASDIASGAQIFRKRCAACHDSDAKSAPDLRSGRFGRGESDWALYRNITRGIPGTAMVAQRVEEIQAWQLVAYLRSRARDASPGGGTGAATGEPGPAVVPLTYDALLRADRTPAAWLTYSGTYRGWRYGALDQVNRDTVSRLRLQWAFQMPTRGRVVEATPIVVGGRMYVTEPPSNVIALDAANGAQIWRYERTLRDGLPVCCGRVNRGVAVLGERVYVATLDAHLVALDARTGAVAWDVAVGDPGDGFSITAAPLAVKDMILIGVSGGEYGIRGFLDAYDARTGARRWRFHTIPGPGEPGHESWAGESWKTGGGATWVTGGFDPDLGLVYWGVGNPGPVYVGDGRRGDNLYTNSMVALEAATGKLKWHFQFTPHDEHDWDSNATPLLIDAEIGSAPRKLLLSANKNGFYYVLDREDGTFLLGRPFAKQTWATGVDARGRPIVRAGTAPTPQGTYVFPSASGATNWWPSSYSPRTGLVYIPVLEKGAVYFRQPDDEAVPHERGDMFLGSVVQFVTSEPVRTFVRALEATTGALRWEHAFPLRSAFGTVGGVLSTAGDLVFVGDNTMFYAFDAVAGKQLWQVNLGGKINAPPATYLSGGRQFVTIAAGRSLFTFALGAP